MCYTPVLTTATVMSPGDGIKVVGINKHCQLTEGITTWAWLSHMHLLVLSIDGGHLHVKWSKALVSPLSFNTTTITYNCHVCFFYTGMERTVHGTEL